MATPAAAPPRCAGITTYSPLRRWALHRRRSMAGTLIGEIREPQEMLDFCAAHAIASDIEVIPIQHQ